MGLLPGALRPASAAAAVEVPRRPVAAGVPRALDRHRARAARPGDAAGIAALIAAFTGDGRLLPRAVAEVEAALDAFVVIAALDGRVIACAALQEYSPSLAEVASVAVAPDAQGRGLGSRVVRAVERLARRRGHRELFALSLADRFFASLGYDVTALARYPEKLARYAALGGSGVTPLPKRCFRKRLRGTRTVPRRAPGTPFPISRWSA